MNNKGIQFVLGVKDEGSPGIKKVDSAFKDLDRQVDKTHKSMISWRKEIDSTSKRLSFFRSKILLLAGGAGLGMLAKSFLDAGRDTENFQIRLQTLLGSVEEGAKLFKSMEEYASKVPFTYTEIMDSASQLAGVMKGGVDEINKWMPVVGDMAAAWKIPLGMTTQNFVRMFSAGAASADLFREKGILAALGFQAGVTTSAEETRKILWQEYTKMDSKFRDSTIRMAGSWDGMISMISDSWLKFRNLVMAAGVYDELKKALSEVNIEFKAWVKNNEDIIKQNVPKYVKGIKDAIIETYNFISQNKEIIEYGLIGLALYGKKGVLPGIAVGKAVGDTNKLIDLYKRAEKLKEKGVLTGWEIWKAGKLPGPDLEGLITYWENVLKGTGIQKFKMPKMEISSPGADLKEQIIDQLAFEIPDTTYTVKLKLGEREGTDKGYIEELKKNYLDAMLEIEDEMAYEVPDALYNFRIGLKETEESVKDLGDTGEDIFKDKLKNAVTGWANNFSSTLTDMVWDADVSFKSILKSFGKMITQMVIQQKIVSPLLGMAFPKATPAVAPSAQGNVFSNGNIQSFGKGTVVYKPTIFPMASGMGLIGEAGPEGVLPLTRTPGGDLGVKSIGGAPNVSINLINQSGTSLNAQQKDIRNESGRWVLDVVMTELRYGRELRSEIRSAI